MSKIVDVDRSEPVGRYTHGTTFSKGDYIATNREYWAKTDDGQEVQLDDKKIRLVLGVTSILWNVVKHYKIIEIVVISSQNVSRFWKNRNYKH